MTRKKCERAMRSSSRRPTTRTSAVQSRIDAVVRLLAVAVLILPVLMDDYYVGEATWVFITASAVLADGAGRLPGLVLGTCRFLGIAPTPRYSCSTACRGGLSPWLSPSLRRAASRRLPACA